MTPYRVVDRLTEPTSWIGVLVAIIGYAIPLLISPTAWSHVAGCVQTLLGTALFFLPENRAVLSFEHLAEPLLHSLSGGFPASLDGPRTGDRIDPAAAPGFGAATMTRCAAALALLPLLATLAGGAMLMVGLSSCGATPAQVQTISSDLACFGQAAANATTAGFTAAGDSADAAISSAASVATGTLCTGLAVGAKLGPPAPAPAAVAAPSPPTPPPTS